MNVCTFLGRLTRDVELRYAGETPVANFGIAVNRRFKKDGQPEADFPRLVAFGKNAENIAKFFKKGSEIVVTGHLQTGSYEDKDGKKVYTTDIIVDQWSFTGGSKSDGQDGQTPAPQQQTGFVPVEDDDMDDLPF